MLEILKDLVRAYADRHANHDGVALTPVPGLRMMRRDQPNAPLHSVYRPLVCLVLQGAKHLSTAREQRVCRAGEAVVVGVDRPVVGTILRASGARPYLAVAIDLDMEIIRQLAARAPLPRPAPPGTAVTFQAPFDHDALNCAFRLIRLIDHPEAVPVLRPAILTELHYWLLRSRHGEALARLAVPSGYHQRIARAIAVIRSAYRRHLPVEELAAAAHMSPSAFHRHFKSVTSLSPRQFQKQLRLVEARRLMLNEGLTAARAAATVGYQSASQFTRDYARMFGAPPRSDVAEASQEIASRLRRASHG